MKKYMDVIMVESNGLITEKIQIKCVQGVPFSNFKERVHDFVTIAVNEVESVLQEHVEGILKFANGVLTYEIPEVLIQEVGIVKDNEITFTLDGSDEGSLEVDLGNLVEVIDEIEDEGWVKV